MLNKFGLFLTIAATVACSVAPEPAPQHHYLLFIDVSGSVSDAQRGRWSAAIDAFASGLQCGDSVSIYGVHDATAMAARRFHFETVPVPTSGGLREALQCRKSLTSMREGTVRRAHDLLNASKTASHTDLLGMLDVAHRAATGTPATALVFSDALNSTSELNLEQTMLREADFPDLIRNLGGQHAWSTGMLSAVTFHFVLNSVELGERKPLNSRQSLEAFWSTMIRSLGGAVSSFSPDLEVSRLERSAQ